MYNRLIGRNVSQRQQQGRGKIHGLCVSARLAAAGHSSRTVRQASLLVNEALADYSS
jgi:hypothetical protein